METTQLQTGQHARSRTSVRTINIAVLAMGGEGGGVLADWIVDLAEHSGYLAQTTSVPGVAQRTGSTIYYVELFPEDAARQAGKTPVMALMPVPGEVDVVIASELMEAGRAITRGLVTPDRTTLIASTNRVYSMTERTAMADGRVDSDALLRAGNEAARKFVANDFAALAEQNHSVISATLFGALAASGTLPFSRPQFEEAITRSGISVQSSLAAFAAGFDTAATPAASKTVIPEAETPKLGLALQDLSARVSSKFPPASHSILLPAIQRLAEYQDLAYAAEYLDKLEPVNALDQHEGRSLLCETARYLALWMSYEDAIRVADLKIRRTRFERVAKETHTSSAQLLQISEFLYPRVEEFTDVMPARLGAWVLRTSWATRLFDRFAGKGRVLATTSLRGFVQLYIIASQRSRRRGTLRFKREHQKIEIWLGEVKKLAVTDYDLALELAQCPRLIKGYGDTHALGSRNFDLLMSAIPVLSRRSDAARALRTLRETALADESGKKLPNALGELGLPKGGQP